MSLMHWNCFSCSNPIPFDSEDPDDADLLCPSCGMTNLFDNGGFFLRSVYLCPTTPGEPAVDVVNHPPHYTSGPIECFDAMKSAFTKEEMIAYCKVAAFKYLWREGKKDDPIQERKKAVWYLQKSIELMEETK